MSDPAVPATPAEPPPPPKRALGIIFLIVFMDLLGFGVIIPQLPFYARQYNASALEVTVLFSIYSIFQFMITPSTVIAFLTILGYSLYDTVVVFDRMRENESRAGAKRPPWVTFCPAGPRPQRTC